MRKFMMDGLRKAGDKLNSLDAAYADAVGKTAQENFLDAWAIYGRAVPLKEFNGPVFPIGEYEAFGGIGPRTLNQSKLGKHIDRGLFVSNIASRYALPAGGVTLAGKGLFDITQGLYAIAADTPVFGGPEDGAQPGQLPLN